MRSYRDDRPDRDRWKAMIADKIDDIADFK
jgi:hypothetical protein